MEEEASYNLDLQTWTLIGDLHHKMFWLRQKELNRYNIAARKLHILRVIQGLGTNTTVKSRGLCETYCSFGMDTHKAREYNTLTWRRKMLNKLRLWMRVANYEVEYFSNNPRCGDNYV